MSDAPSHSQEPAPAGSDAQEVPGPDGLGARLQRLAYKGFSDLGLVPAPWPARIAAYLLDRVVIYGVTLAVSVPLLFPRISRWVDEAWESLPLAEVPSYGEFLSAFFEAAGPSGLAQLTLWVTAIFAAVSAVYVIPQHAVWGRTVGKRLFGLVVVSPDSLQGGYPDSVSSLDGETNSSSVRGVGWKLSLYRWLLPALSVVAGGPGAAVSLLGYLAAFFNDLRRGAHDMMASTMVVPLSELRS